MLRLTSVVAALFALSLLAGCGGGGSSSGTPPPSAQLSITPTTISLGSVVVGASGTASTATLTNTGNASLTITSIVLSDTSNFSMTNGCGASLAAAASCKLTFTFTPQSAAALSATVTVSDNSSGSPQTIALTGTGTAGTPQITFAPSNTLTFPNTTIGQTSAPQTLTVTNTGNAALTLSVGALAGASADFTSTTTCGTSLAPNANCTFTFAFKPQTTGNLTAVITLTDNASNSPQTIVVTGIGTAVPLATLTPSPFTFPPTAVGSTSVAQSFTLANPGTAALSISGVTLGGQSPADFAITAKTCPATLAAGLTCTISVTFTPATAANYGATLTITDNAGGTAGSTQIVTLQGNGTAPPPPVLTFTPASGLSFPTTTVGQTSAAQGLTLSNTGGSALNFSYVPSGATADFTLNTAASTCGTSLAVGSSCTLTFAFAPQATGNLSETLTFTDNAATPTQTVALTGTATPGPTPQGTLTPATGLVFPTTAAGTTAAQTQVVTLTNTGNATLTIGGIAIGGTNPSDFSQTNACPATLAQNTSCQITVSFSPAAAASYTAALTVTDNSGNALLSTQSVPLKGIGSSGPVTVTHTLYPFPEKDNSVTPLYALIKGAKSTIDMTMYEFADTTFLSDLVAACANKVTVRVLLDGGTNTKSINTSAYTQLNTSGTNCSAEFSNTAFQATHQKTITVDGTTTAIMTLNLQSQYYSTSRDFALIENDPADIAAIETIFNADYAAGTPYGGTQGASDFANQGGPGDDLIWAPTTATSNPLAPRTASNDMLGIIKGATKTLLIENADMGPSGDVNAGNIVSALEAACKNKVTVNIVMSEDSTTPPLSPYASNWIALEVAGCGVHVYADTTTGMYIHANAVVADYGLSTQNAYVGSIKYSDASMVDSRELGLYVTDPTAVTLLNTTMSSDYAGGVVFQGGIVD